MTAIGIDVGGTNIRVGVVSAAGEVLDHVTKSTPPKPELALAAIVDMVRSLDRAEVTAIGMGVPGRVDTAAGKILSGGFVNLSGLPVIEALQAIGGKPVTVANVAKMALVAEARIGAARGARHAVLLTIGTGIGGAAMDSGVVLRGRATAGELGHISVKADGLLCICGRLGCVETESSGTALRRHIAEAGLPKDTVIGDLLSRQDQRARAVIRAWAQPLRAAIDSLVACFDPECVVLGGGLGHAACQALVGFPAEAAWYQCPVLPAELGDRAGVIGAGLMALA